MSSPLPFLSSGTRWTTRRRTCTVRPWRTSLKSWLCFWLNTWVCEQKPLNGWSGEPRSWASLVRRTKRDRADIKDTDVLSLEGWMNRALRQRPLQLLEMWIDFKFLFLVQWGGDLGSLNDLLCSRVEDALYLLKVSHCLVHRHVLKAFTQCLKSVGVICEAS